MDGFVGCYGDTVVIVMWTVVGGIGCYVDSVVVMVTQQWMVLLVVIVMLK